MTRGRLLALVLAPTLVLGLVIGGFVVVDARARQADVERADDVAQKYAGEVAGFRAALVKDLEAVDAADPTDVAEVIEARGDDLPELASAPERGESGSSAYAAARQGVVTLRESWQRLGDVVDVSVDARSFVLAANRALDLNPAELAPPTVVTSGDPLRTQLLPPMRSALATFEATDAPEAATPARDAVRAALQHVVTEAERLAARLDAGQGGSFQYAEQYTAARAAVRQYADGVRADLREALDAVVAESTVVG